jgi:hypothetical protein
VFPNPNQSSLPLLSDVNHTPNLHPVVENPSRQYDWITILWIKGNRKDGVFGFFDGLLIWFGNR